MIPFAADAVSEWDKWTAIGTIAAALMTLLAIVAAFVIGASDRRSAERLAVEARRAAERDTQAQIEAARQANRAQIEASQISHDSQLAAAREAQDRQLTTQRADRLREHHVDLLLALSHALAQYESGPGTQNGHEGRAAARALLLALPSGAEGMAAVRHLCGNLLPDAFAAMPTFADVYPGAFSTPAVLAIMGQREVAAEIKRVSQA